ncbi:hypothetical protein EIP91_010104 [Steccherinum ochraceum]|uniref:Uncharacterized protein n=1 Tax=Steccherinum ochraceum TaxID=92696 RepID=A0A4R0S1Y4_9APHY|nr:hypothetical protein EIP91_010104 [Steccherinum ochraceum]
MSRKRFVVSLAEDKHSRTLSEEEWQIAFVLIPTDLSGPHELFKTVHPVVWEVYDCTFGEPQTFDCDLTLGVSTVRKEPGDFVVPVLSRTMPVKAEFKLQAFYGKGLKEMQQVRTEHMKPVLDSSGKPWAAVYNDLPKISSLYISRTKKGDVIICSEQKDSPKYNIVPGEQHDYCRKDHGVPFKELDEDYLAMQRLIIEVTNITAGRGKGKTHDLEKLASIDEIAAKVKGCQDAIAELRKWDPVVTKNQLEACMGEFARVEHDVSKLHESMKELARKMARIEKSVEELSSVSKQPTGTKVEEVCAEVAIIQEKLSSVESTLTKDVKHVFRSVKDVTSVARHMQTEIPKLEESLSRSNIRLERVEGSVRTAEQSTRGLVARIEELELNKDTARAQRGMGEVNRRLNRAEENIQQLKNEGERAAEVESVLKSKIKKTSSIADDARQRVMRLEEAMWGTPESTQDDTDSGG